MEQKVRNTKKNNLKKKKKKAAIVLNQPEHSGSTWQEEQKPVDVYFPERTGPRQLQLYPATNT